MHINQLFGKNLRFLRNAAGIAVRGNAFSQQEFAGIMGVSRKTVVFWESGQIPSKRKMAFLCEVISKRLGLEKLLTPEEILNEDLKSHFIVIPERAEVRRVHPEQKKMLQNIFVRAANLPADDLVKILKIVEDFMKKR